VLISRVLRNFLYCSIKIGLDPTMPAQLTRTPIGPSCSSTSLMAFSTVSSSVASNSHPLASTPSFFTSSTVALISRRSNAAIVAPAFANCSATPCPIPRAEPSRQSLAVKQGNRSQEQHFPSAIPRNSQDQPPDKYQSAIEVDRPFYEWT
jgi:hypothetical protein